MELNYKSFGEGFPIIILHGLLGSLDNWQSIAKKLADPTLSHKPYCVYILDQRNHGKSPHTAAIDYTLLTADLHDFFTQHQLKKAHVIGHSMGGKVAMNFALLYPQMVEKLVVVDITPATYNDKHNSVFTALFAVDVTKATAREYVENTLRQKLENDETTVQFLMKGLSRADEGFEWKFNLDALHTNYNRIAASIHSANPYLGKTLFVKGAKSSYINSTNYSTIVDLFPNHELAEIADAGHWVHAEKPIEFLKEVIQFL